MSKLHTATSGQSDTKAVAQQMGREIAHNVAQAVNQAITDTASKTDAKKRETVLERYGAVVANSLAGKALDSLYRQCLQANASNAQDQDVGAPDPATYFTGS